MNGNTQFGTATPNGNVNTDAWLDSTASDTLFSAGALKGFAVTPTSTTGLSLNIGGTAGVNDVAIAKNVAGDTARIAGHASTPYVLTLPGAPGTSGQSKVFSIVAFIDTTITAMTQNGVDTVGVTYVAGTAATTGSQVPPTDAQIRSAIPNGQTAFISVVANVTLAYGATAIVAGNIAANKSTMPSQNVALNPQPFGVLFDGQNTVIGGNTLGTIIFTKNTFRGGFSQSGNDLVIPQDGWYEVSGGTEAMDGGVSNPWSLVIVSTQYGRITPEKYVSYPGRGVGNTTSGTAYLFAGDHINLRVWNGGAGSTRFGVDPSIGRTIYISFLSAKMI